MTILKAVTCGNDEELQSKEITILNGKIERCPGCTSEEVGVTENVELGLMFIKNHNMPPIIGTTGVMCDYSFEPLKIVACNETEEFESVLH